MDTIEKLIDKCDAMQNALKQARQEVENEISRTSEYKKVFEATMNGNYEISEKDAHKHAIKVCLTNIKKKLKE